jgi:deoxyribonuclease V
MRSPDNDTAGWDGSAAGARALQAVLASEVRLRDGFPKPLSTIAGFAIAPEGDSPQAAVVLLDANLAILESYVASVPAPTPLNPDVRSFRELPPLLAALRMLPVTPDLALIAGDGTAHPQRFGLASHFGLATGISSIGVARQPLVGTASPLHQVRGAYTPLRDQGRQIGWLLRTQVHGEPLVVSPGHNVAMASAADLVMRFVTRHRLPEPLRLAEQLLSCPGGIDSLGGESE